MVNFVILTITAYLLGSIPFGLLVCRFHGIDLRKIGSGNIGATNVSRALGKTWAYFCFVLDLLKGLLPMLAVPAMNPASTPADTTTLGLWLLVGCAAIVGHVFPIYLGFKGGKGVATSLGVVLGLWPYYTICGLIASVVWILCFLIWRYVSLASIAASAAFPIVLAIATLTHPDWSVARLWPLFVVAVLMPMLVIARHAENIKRLLEGSEHKMGRK